VGAGRGDARRLAEEEEETLGAPVVIVAPGGDGMGPPGGGARPPTMVTGWLWPAIGRRQWLGTGPGGAEWLEDEEVVGWVRRQ
jgi:hypothetical protein